MRTQTKRGPGRPRGSKNKTSNRRRTRRKFVNASAIATATPANTGENVKMNDPVIAAFAQKRDILTKQLADLNASEESYQRSMGVSAATAQATTDISRVPLTRKGTVDMRSSAGREFIAQHPEYEGKQVLQS